MTGSDQSVNGVVCTDGPCVEDSNIYESAVALCRTGSDQTVNNVISIVSPGGPGNETGSVVDAPKDVIVMSFECQGFAPTVNPKLISRPSDLVNRFGFLFARFARCCVIGLYHNRSCQI